MLGLSHPKKSRIKRQQNPFWSGRSVQKFVVFFCVKIASKNRIAAKLKKAQKRCLVFPFVLLPSVVSFNTIVRFLSFLHTVIALFLEIDTSLPCNHVRHNVDDDAFGGFFGGGVFVL